MSRWIVELEVERLLIPDDPDGNWVEIKKHLDVGDQDDLKERLVEIEQVTSGNGANRAQRRAIAKGQQPPVPELRAKYKPSTVALLAIAIKDWSFLDGKGQKIPVTEANIRRMDPWLAGWLQDALEERNPLVPPAIPTKSS